MKDELITYDTAVLSRHKGYINTQDRSCWIVTDKNPEPKFYENSENVPYLPAGAKYINRPSQSVLQRWLREVHNTHIYIEPFRFKGSNKILYEGWLVRDESKGVGFGTDYHNNYEDALEELLYEALTRLS